MKKLLIVLVSIVAVIVIAVAVVLGYLGYFKPVARVLGTDKPKDLGVSYSEADLVSVRSKLRLELNEAPAGSLTKYEGQQEIEESFSSAELTALVNGSRWSYTPIENVQIKIGDNGFAESSGILRLDLMDEYLGEVASGTVSGEELDKVKGILPDSFPYYVSGAVTYNNGTISFDFGSKSVLAGLISKVYASSVSVSVGSLTVGKLSVPAALLESSQGRVDTFINTGLGHISGLNISSLEFDGGQMKLKATVPTTKYRPVE